MELIDRMLNKQTLKEYQAYLMLSVYQDSLKKAQVNQKGNLYIELADLDTILREYTQVSK